MTTFVDLWDSGCVASGHRRGSPIPTVFSLAPSRVVCALAGQQGARGVGLPMGSV